MGRASVLLLSVTLACVGDNTIPPGPDASSSDATTSDVAVETGAVDSGVPETPLVCDAGLLACGAQCADITSSATDCGACGHDCGGGLCTKGVCQPVVVVDSLSNPVFDIDTKSVYYNSADKVLSCPLAGCGGLAPTQIGALTATVYGHDVGGTMMVGGGNVFFMADALTGTSGPYFHVCDIAGGCPSSPVVLQGGNHQGFTGTYGIYQNDVYVGWYKYLVHFHCTGPGTCNAGEDVLGGADAGAVPSAAGLAADATGFYLGATTDPTTLVKCPLSGAGCVPVTLGSVGPTMVQLVAANNLVYVLETGGDGYTNGSIKTCPTTGACTPATFVSNQPFPLALAVDATDVAWFTRDGTPNPAVIVTCPTTGCKGGPRTLTSNQTGAYGLKSDGKFIYWATPIQILRVAK